MCLLPLPQHQRERFLAGVVHSRPNSYATVKRSTVLDLTIPCFAFHPGIDISYPTQRTVVFGKSPCDHVAAVGCWLSGMHWW